MNNTWVKKDNDRTIIYLSGFIDTDVFYNDFMDEIYNYQFTSDSRIRRLAPIVSFEKVSGLDSNVLPCFVAVGVIMKNYYAKPCQLLFDYGFKGLPVLQFLSTTNFLYLVKDNLNIYDYIVDNVGGFDVLEKKYNPDYIIKMFPHIEDYYGRTEEEQYELKYRIQDDLALFDVPRLFGEVLQKVLNPNSREYDWCIRSIAEIIANAELYSLSDSFASVQAKKNIVRISLCDVGIGFANSLQLKHITINNNADIKRLIHIYDNGKNGIGKITIEDLNFFLIALKEAEDSALSKDSFNLYRLIDIITSINGIVKIHFNKTRVAFDKTLLNIYKNRSQDSFLEYLLSNYNSNSPYLQIYKANITGVHIEIVIKS